MRIPAMFQGLNLSDEDKDEVAELQREQAEYFRNRALKKLEEGSDYSSDFEEVEKSEYVSTDGEGSPQTETYTANNIKVLRGASFVYPVQSRSDDMGNEEERRTGTFGHMAE